MSAASLRPISEPLVASFSGLTLTFRAYRCPEWNEYQVRVTRGGRPVPQMTYYTEDKVDALGTLKAMHERAQTGEVLDA